MSQIRKLHYQQLEKRELMATDLATAVANSGLPLQTVAETIASNPGLDEYFVKQNFEIELAFSFTPMRDVSSVRLGDSIIAVEGRQLRLFAPDDSPLGYSQQSLLTTQDRIRNVTKLDDRLLIVTERHNGLLTRFQSTLILASISADHQFQILDSSVRNSQFYAAGTNSDGLFINWKVPDPVASPDLAQAQLDMARVQLNVNSDDYEYSLIDYLPTDATSIDDRPLLSANGTASIIWHSDARLVVRASDGLHLLDANTGSDVPLNTGEVTWVRRISSSGSDLVIEGGMGEPGMGPFMGVHGYGTVVLDQALNIKATTTQFTGDQATLKSEHEAFGGVYNDGRVSDVTAFPRLGGLRIVTQVDQTFTQQLVDLPGYRVGFTPAFVLDSDTIVSVRAQIADDDIKDGAIPDLSLYVLKRNGDGKFENSSVVPLPKFDPRAFATVQTDGTITLQNKNQSLIIRTSNDQIAVQSLDTSRDWLDSQQFRKVTGIGDLVLYTGDYESQLLSSQTTQAYIAPEPRDPEASDAAFVTLDMVIEAMNSGAVITDLDLPQSSGENDLPIQVANGSVDPLDVNKDGMVTPLDALLIINMLNAGESDVRVASANGLDINSDGFVTPLDALTVINQLNQAAEAEPLSYLEELNRRAKSP